MVTGEIKSMKITMTTRPNKGSLKAKVKPSRNQMLIEIQIILDTRTTSVKRAAEGDVYNMIQKDLLMRK